MPGPPQDMFANCVSGGALFAIGYFMRDYPIVPEKGIRLQLLCGLLLRFIGSPLLMFIVSYPFGLRGLVLKSVVLQAALPQAITTFAVGIVGWLVIYTHIYSVPCS